MTESFSRGGLRTFIIISIGQLISIIGTGLTNFAIGIWVYQSTGSVTGFALTILSIALPSILISPVAGALVDRWDRRRAMILGDSVSGLCTLGIALLFYGQRLELWHVCVLIAISSIAGVIHSLAFAATIPLIIPKEQFARIGGIIQIGPAVAQIISPLIAGVLLGVMPLFGLLLLDYATFLIAVGTLLVVRIPKPSVSEEGKSAKGGILRESMYGWVYIKQRKGLKWLLVFFAIVNFILAMSNVLLTPMLLGLASVEVVGLIASVASFGMLAGSVLLGFWGGPKRRILGVLGFGALLGFCLLLMGLRPSAVLIAIGGFGLVFAVPIIDGCSQAIWLVKTPPDVQGRVLAMRKMIEWSAIPLAYILAGPLSDKIFEPLLSEGGALADSVGRIMGVGPGRGIGLLLIILGSIMMLASIAGYWNPRLRLVECEIPDAIPDEPNDAVDDGLGVSEGSRAAAKV